MTVWVKEVPGVLTAEYLVPLLNADVELKIFQESEDLMNYRVLMKIC